VTNSEENGILQQKQALNALIGIGCFSVV